MRMSERERRDTDPSLNVDALFDGEELESPEVAPLVAIPALEMAIPAPAPAGSMLSMPALPAFVVPRSAEATDAASEAHVAASFGEWEKARTAMARALDEAPNDPELHATMAWYTNRSAAIDPVDRLRLAQHHLNVSLELSPNNPYAPYFQGRVWADQGNGARARIAFEAALRLDPAYRPAQQAIDRLDGKRTPVVGVPIMGRAKKRPRLRSPALFGALAALGAMLVAGRFLSAGQDLVDLKDKLGTGMPLFSSDERGNELHLDFGDIFVRMPRHEREYEMLTIAGGAKKLGYLNVFVHGNGKLIGEAHNGIPCLAGECGK